MNSGSGGVGINTRAAPHNHKGLIPSLGMFSLDMGVLHFWYCQVFDEGRLTGVPSVNACIQVHART